MKVNQKNSNYWYKQYRQWRNISDGLSRQGHYFKALLASDEFMIDLYRLGLCIGYFSNFHHEIYKNIWLNHNILRNIKPMYKLNALFDDYSYWYNNYSPSDVLNDSLKHNRKLVTAISTYESTECQNLLLNADIRLRQTYGCFGLTAIKDYYHFKNNKKAR